MTDELPDRKLLQWVSRRSHLQISRTHVLPVLFKSRVLPRAHNTPPQNPPPAFPDTEVKLSDGLFLLKEWISNHIDRIFRQTSANIKPGTLETPDILKSNKHQFTVWLEPTAATFALLTPSRSSPSATTTSSTSTSSKAPVSHGLQLDSFHPTPQTLYVTGELIS